MGLSGQFFATATILLVSVAVLGGYLQTRWIVSNLITGNADVASIFMRGIIAPHVQVLATQKGFTDAQIIELEDLLEKSGLQEQMESIKIWMPDGTIAYSKFHNLIGQRFESDEVRRAMTGALVVEFDDLDQEENAHEEELNKNTLLEMYLPIIGPDGRPIAVGEFYLDLLSSHEIATNTIRGSWALRIAFILIALVVLALLVRVADKIIANQQRQLRSNYRTATKLARQNGELRAVAEETRRKSAKANEELLSLIGAEIHDGPLQVLSLVMLMSDGQNGSIPAGAQADPIAQKGRVLVAEAISELRTISSGLILPEIGELSADEAIRLAIARHERYSGTLVNAIIDELPPGISQGLKACMYRFVQECLNNSTRHAGGAGQRVEARLEKNRVTLTVSDGGPGMLSSVHPNPEGRPQLGLLGARNRVESFGGSMEIDSRSDTGAVVRATLPIELEAS